jgi:hypothetical protein
MKEEDKEFFLLELNYSDAQREQISRIEYATFFGFPLKLDPNSNNVLWSTLEGIEQQIEKFNDPCGLVYYFKFFDSRLDMAKRVVHR